MKLIKKSVLNSNVLKKINKDTLNRNKLLSFFLLERGIKVIRKDKVNLYKSVPLGLVLGYNDVLYRVGYFTYKILPMVTEYKIANRKQTKKGVPEKDIHFDKLDDKYSKKIFDLCNNLGGVYIKIGQVFGGRNDIFPSIYQKRLEPLLENAKPVPYKLIKSRIGYLENKLDYIGKTPIGVASLGQVYKGSYLGKEVVIKVLKPKVKRDTKMDLLLTNNVLKYTLKGLTGIMKDFSEITLKEFNYLDEADVTIELDKRTTIENVYFPKVYRDLSTKNTLVLEYIEGVSLLNYMKTGSVENVGFCINKVIEIMFHQIFKLGLFSSDPHPGNFFIKETEGLPLVVPLDFGQIGRLSKEGIENLKILMYALKDDNSKEILYRLDKMGFRSKNTGEHIDQLKVRYTHCMFNDYMKEDMVTFNNMTKDIGWKTIPIEYMLVNKAFITLSGLLSLCKLEIKLIDLFILRLNMEKNIYVNS
jgi:predicted unusual protein kinase regulating ubiquinone biosynthesis (AarF/ABC1/UbiB family)